MSSDNVVQFPRKNPAGIEGGKENATYKEMSPAEKQTESKEAVRDHMVPLLANALGECLNANFSLLRGNQASPLDLATIMGEAVTVMVYGSVLSVEEKKPGELSPPALVEAFEIALQGVVAGFRRQANLTVKMEEDLK